MEQEILSWLETTYDKKLISFAKETLWNEFVDVGRVDSKCRDAFFAHLGRCIRQSSLKGITVTCTKGKQNGYRSLQKKKGQRFTAGVLSVNGYHLPFVKKTKRKKQRGIALKLIF